MHTAYGVELFIWANIKHRLVICKQAPSNHRLFFFAFFQLKMMMNFLKNVKVNKKRENKISKCLRMKLSTARKGQKQQLVQTEKSWSE